MLLGEPNLVSWSPTDGSVIGVEQSADFWFTTQAFVFGATTGFAADDSFAGEVGGPVVGPEQLPPLDVAVFNRFDAVEGGANGEFVFIRSGDTSQPLTINFSISGTATSGSDYQSFSSTSVQFAPGESFIELPVVPQNDGVEEPTEFISLSLLPTSGHGLGLNASANMRVFNAADPPPAGNGDGLFARYYNTKDLTDVRKARIESPQDKIWSTTQVAPAGAGVGADNFSVRWTGKVQPLYSEDYTFTTWSDDGVRLWVNGNLVIDNWTVHGLKKDNSQPIALVAGQQYDIRVEYFENTGGALFSLDWLSASQAAQAIPLSQLYSNTSTVGNLVWLDKNGDGKQDAGEPGVRGIELHVQNAANVDLVPPVKTGADGTYSVLLPANEQIKLRVTEGPPQLGVSPKGQGNDAIDSDFDSDPDPLIDGVVTGLFNAPAAGQTDLHKDLGLTGPLIDLDVTNNGSLLDPEDGVENYLPGYKGTEPVLTKTTEQAMQVIVLGLTPNATYRFCTGGTMLC